MNTGDPRISDAEFARLLGAGRTDLERERELPVLPKLPDGEVIDRLLGWASLIVLADRLASAVEEFYEGEGVEIPRAWDRYIKRRIEVEGE